MFVDQGMDDIDNADSVIERQVHILTEGIEPFRSIGDKGFSRANAAIQHMASRRVQKRLLIREVPVKRSYANTGPCCDGIPGRFSTNL